MQTVTDALRLTFHADSDGTGELFVQVRSAGFSGSSSAWFRDDQLVEFAKSIESSYPLQANASVQLEGGFLNQSGAGIEQLHVGLSFYPIGGAGEVGCRVVLNTPLHPGERPESQSTVKLELRTTYEQLRAFAQAVEILVQGFTDEATLQVMR